jgi:hypothetical protein
MTQVITDNEQGLGGSQPEGFLASSSFVIICLGLLVVGWGAFAELSKKRE